MSEQTKYESTDDKDSKATEVSIKDEGKEMEAELAANSEKEGVEGVNGEGMEISDPLLARRSNIIREGDHVILVFGDGRQIFTQCLTFWKGKSPPLKISKRSYPTGILVGLQYGTVLELGQNGLKPLPEGEGLIPAHPEIKAPVGDGSTEATSTQPEAGSTIPRPNDLNDNRHLVDDNTSQGLSQNSLEQLRKEGVVGSEIIDALIENSSTFDKKTAYSKAKYIAKKQMKYQPRCRLVRCTPSSICAALFVREPRRMLNMREDTLGQILSYSNVSAGCQVLVLETCMGVVTGALAHRMGGYGKIISIYSGQQPSYTEMLQRFNLTFAEHNSIKWIHSGDVFGEKNETSGSIDTNDSKEGEGSGEAQSQDEEDLERLDREGLKWPCPLQSHTRSYMDRMESDKERTDFLLKRSARFARKLTRHTPMEAIEYLNARPCDTVIIVARYDPTATLLDLLPYLAPSSPFVLYCEYIEPLAQCFRELQKQSLAINIRLSDTWMREYQVLPGRTHPSMNMTQSGGFILTGIKLCPHTGHNELDEELLKELRETVGGRRGRRNQNKAAGGDNDDADNNKRKRRRRKKRKTTDTASNNNENNDD